MLIREDMNIEQILLKVSADFGEFFEQPVGEVLEFGVCH